MLELGLKFTLAYLLGSVLGSMVVGLLHGGVDIRKVGSGNAGGTNALRTQGKMFALGVMLIDVGKGILAAAVIPDLYLPGIGIDPSVPRALITYSVALAAIIGHVFPLWFGFKGGKGGATAAGLLIYFDPLLALPILGLWVAIVCATGFVGLATMLAAAGAAVFIGAVRLPQELGFFTFACLTAALIVYTHRGNIKRMLNRSEPRFGRSRAADKR